MTRRVPFFIALALLLGVVFILVRNPPEAHREWKAGVAVVEITPKESMWMSGYASRDRPAEGTLTPLWAKALVLEDWEENRVLLVTMDLIGMGRALSNRIRDQLEERHGLARKDVMLNFSHTHTGPIVGDNLMAMYFLADEEKAKVRVYADYLEKTIVELAGQAIAAIEPSTITYGQGEATFAVNRRNNREDEILKIREEGTLKGPVDHAVPVMKVVHGKLQHETIVFGYACHSTVLSFFQWSGDYPGFAQIELEKRSPNTTAMFWAGCGADLNPLPRREVALAQDYGKQLAQAVSQVLDHSEMKLLPGPITNHYNEIPLTFAEVPTEAELEQRRDHDEDRYVASSAAHLLENPNVFRHVREGYPYPVQTWHFGDELSWVALGGEVVVDYALRMKKESAANGKAIWVAGYSNDVMAYIPSRRVLKEGGYEGGSSMRYYGLPGPWAEDVEERVMREVAAQR